MYCIDNSQTASLIDDIPVASGGVLTVLPAYSDVYVYQEYRTINEVYIRRVKKSDSVATEWIKL